MNDAKGRVKLADTATGPGRSTATLLGSLHSRITALYSCSGADAIASLTAGFAELGRAVSKTSRGARLRHAMERTRATVNGRNVWKKIRLTEWTCGIYPAPILDQLRNDLALLLADDIDPMLEAMPIPGEVVRLEGMGETPDVRISRRDHRPLGVFPRADKFHRSNCCTDDAIGRQFHRF